MKMKNIITTIVLLFSFISIAFSQQSAVLTKEKTIELYKTLYLSSKIDSITWNGNLKKCESGSLEKGIFVKASNRINFFRLVNGLNTVKNNTEFNQKAQDAALLIKANNVLTHHPSSSMECYSESASSGCSKSCLGFTDFINFPGISFITGFLDDYGSSNYYVGHRRWVLYSKLAEFGYGATNSTEALLVVDGISDGVTNDSVVQPQFVAYPWSGYVPADLIFPKWSFSIPDGKTVDFDNTTIIMTDSDGNIIENEKLEEYKNFLDPTIVWTVTGLFSEYEITYAQNKMEENGYLNKKITVLISNVIVDGETKDYKYTVVPIKI
jgi:hypothetical protein